MGDFTPWWLTIQSTSSELFRLQVWGAEPIQEVKIEAMTRLHIDPSQVSRYRLVFDGEKLRDSGTFNDLAGSRSAPKVPSGATLLLVHAPRRRSPEIIRSAASTTLARVASRQAGR